MKTAREPRIRNAHSTPPASLRRKALRTLPRASQTGIASVEVISEPIRSSDKIANKSKIPLAFSPAGVNSRAASVTARSVKEHALDTFGSAEKAEHWFARPNPLFDGNTPQRVLESDPSWVEAELVRIDCGIYV